MEREPMNESRKPIVGHVFEPLSLAAAATTIAAAIHTAKAHRTTPGRPFVAALDGGSGAGKTTLALLAAPLMGAAVVHADDFFDATVPDEHWDAFTDEQKCRRCIDWRRLRREALLPLLAGRSAIYRPYSFETDDRLAQESVAVRPADIILLDGIYSALPELGDLVDCAILIRVRPELRYLRHNARENSDDLDWHRRWDSAESHYFSRIRPPSSYDLVLDLE